MEVSHLRGISPGERGRGASCVTDTMQYDVLRVVCGLGRAKNVLGTQVSGSPDNVGKEQGSSFMSSRNIMGLQIRKQFTFSSSGIKVGRRKKPEDFVVALAS